jgi:hypothetical protein
MKRPGVDRRANFVHICAKRSRFADRCANLVHDCTTPG